MLPYDPVYHRTCATMYVHQRTCPSATLHVYITDLTRMHYHTYEQITNLTCMHHQTHVCPTQFEDPADELQRIREKVDFARVE